MKEKGTIIIMVMWLLAILSLFAVGLGYRSSIELRITGFYLDRIRCSHLGQLAVYKVFSKIANDQKEKVDLLNEYWSNSEGDFKEAEYGKAKITVSHLADSNDEEKIILYGASDECGKININTVPKPILESDYWKENFAMDKDLVEAITHWRKKDRGGKDLDAWYKTTYDYEARHGSIPLLEELHFIKDFYDTSRDKNKKRARLKNIITCHGKGTVNINTAPKEVLNALFVCQGEKKQFSDSDREDMVRMVIEYRNGEDGLPGTSDDNIFKNKNIETALETHEAGRLTMLNWLRTKKIVGVTSDTFKIDVSIAIENKNMIKRVSAIVTRSKDILKKDAKAKKRSRSLSVVDDAKKKDPMRIIKYFED